MLGLRRDARAEDRLVRMARDQDWLCRVRAGPRKEGLIVASAQLPVCGRGRRAEPEPALERPPDVSDDELRKPGEALALDRPLVAVDEEEKPSALATAREPELQRLAHLELRVVVPEALFHARGVSPVIVVVSPEALVAALAMELGLQLERLGIRLRGSSGEFSHSSSTSPSTYRRWPSSR